MTIGRTATAASPGTGIPPGRASRVVAGVRVGVLVGIALWETLVLSPAHDSTLSIWVALAALPVALMVLLAQEGNARAAMVAGPLCDLAVVTGYCVLHVFSPVASSALLGLLAISTAVAWGATLRVTVPLLGLAGLALQAANDPRRLLFVGLALLGMIWLFAGVQSSHRRALDVARDWQRRAETVLDHVADGVVLTSTHGEVLRLNPAAERLLGVTGAAGGGCDTVLGLRHGERPLDCTSGCALLALAGAQAESGAGSVEVWRAGAGGRQPLLAGVARIDHGELVHSLRDISQLRAADDAKTIFLATTTHELKTPITVVRGFADLLLRHPGLSDDQRLDALGAIRSRAEHLNDIVERLLLTSRIEAGRVSVSVQAVELGPLLHERAVAQSDATARPIDVVAAGLPPVRADPRALATVLDHLLDNAVKYSRIDGTVRLTAEPHAGVVRISVSDDGIGMSAAERSRCFERFWQADSGDRRQRGGSGVGLYIAHSLVHAMGGRLAVESEPGAGSTFSVALPAAEVEAAVPAQADGRAAAALGVPGRRS